MASSFASKEDQNSFRWTEFPTNADDIGAALDLLVDALQRICNRYEVIGAHVPAVSFSLAAYAASIRDRGSGSTKVRAGRCIR